jgi:hypothetical protein
VRIRLSSEAPKKINQATEPRTLLLARHICDALSETQRRRERDGRHVVSADGQPDGNFGAASAKAIAQFQKTKLGVTFVDAVVGPLTAKALLPNFLSPDV